MEVATDRSPATVAVTEIFPSATGCSAMGGPTIPNSTITESSNNLSQFYVIHGALMLSSWGFLLPLGVLLARFFKFRGSNAIWFKLHR